MDTRIGRRDGARNKRDVDDHGLAGEVLVTVIVAPSELAQLQSRGVVAIVTTGGSALSHSAILARSLHLPLVVGAAQALQLVNDGDVLAVDGSGGTVVIERSEEHTSELQSLMRISYAVFCLKTKIHDNV